MESLRGQFESRACESKRDACAGGAFLGLSAGFETGHENRVHAGIHSRLEARRVGLEGSGVERKGRAVYGALTPQVPTI